MRRWMLMVALLMVAVPLRGQSDTVVDIQLNVTPLGVRSVQATWSGPAAVAPSLYRRHLPDGEWEMCAVSPTSPWVDSLPFTPCQDSLVYRLLSTDEATLHASNPVALLMRDTLPTAACELEVVTVSESTQQVELRWRPSPDHDVMGYLVCMGSPCLATDTLYGRENTLFVTQLSPTEEHRFRIYAFDSCHTASPLTEYVGNLVLQMTTERCEGRVSLQWNAYEQMPGGLDHYAVEVAVDGRPYERVATVGATQSRELTWQAPASARSLQVVVTAHDAAEQYAARSNRCQVTFGTSDTARWMEIGGLKVEEDKSVSVKLCLDPDYHSAPYVLYRSREGEGEVAIAQLSGQGGQTSYTDQRIDCDAWSYEYRVGAVDGCGRNEKKSPVRATIHLTLEESQGVRLRWNSSGDHTDQSYAIERWSHDPADATVVGTTTATEWVDTEVEGESLSEAFHYRVVGTSSAANACGEVDTSQSNEVHYLRPATCWVPNAFMPGASVDGEFCVQWSMIDPQDYSLIIFDRAGREVYTTNNPDDCWDGRYKGELLQQGAYVYRIYVHHLDGQSRVLTGTVLLLR